MVHFWTNEYSTWVLLPLQLVCKLNFRSHHNHLDNQCYMDSLMKIFKYALYCILDIVLTIRTVYLISQTIWNACRVSRFTGRYAFECFIDTDIIANGIKVVISSRESNICPAMNQIQAENINYYRYSWPRCTYGQFGSTRPLPSWERTSPMQSRIKFLILKYLNF